VATLQVSRSLPAGGQLMVSPFIAAGHARVRATILPTTFVPEDFYGRTRLVTLTVGATVHVGARPVLGRYGVARGGG
jgi:hypothetical protein